MLSIRTFEYIKLGYKSKQLLLHKSNNTEICECANQYVIIWAPLASPGFSRHLAKFIGKGLLEVALKLASQGDIPINKGWS